MALKRFFSNIFIHIYTSSYIQRQHSTLLHVCTADGYDYSEVEVEVAVVASGVVIITLPLSTSALGRRWPVVSSIRSLQHPAPSALQAAARLQIFLFFRLVRVPTLLRQLVHIRL